MASENLAITWRRIPERYRLLGSRCENCKSNYFPARKFCPKCRRKGKISQRQFSGKGRIYSFTEVSAGPAGFELETPYILAIVELEEGPRLTAQIVGARPSEISIGEEVEAVFRKIMEDSPEGLIHYGYKFRLAKRGQASF
ncbi:MAG: Zn-ribbon domain-containing OB-fold protein [Candidatus Micrarchaeota archaeon]|nr:Zn-ribbon domain-containing OB-fold protein [Candidatus Micrarchaeota archaeon]